jgi:hypothetical protein
VTNQYVSSDLAMTLFFSSNALARLHDDANPPTVPRRTYQSHLDTGPVVHTNNTQAVMGTLLMNTSPPPPYTAQPSSMPAQLTQNTNPLPQSPQPPARARIDNHLQSLIDRKNAELSPSVETGHVTPVQGAFAYQPTTPPPYSAQPLSGTELHTQITSPPNAKRPLPHIPQTLSPEQLQAQQQLLQQQRLVEIQQKRIIELQQQQQSLIQQQQLQQQLQQQQLDSIQNQLSQLSHPPHSPLPPQTLQSPLLQQLPQIQSPFIQQPQPMTQSANCTNNPNVYSINAPNNLTHTLNYQNNNSGGAYGGFVFTPGQSATSTYHQPASGYPPHSPPPSYTFPAHGYAMGNLQAPQYQQVNNQSNIGMEFPSF